MNFSDKCTVLGELWLFYREEAATNEAWEQFFEYNDIALPATYLINEGYVQAVEDSDLSIYIDETWEMFCDYISIDPNGNYDGIESAWKASSNPPLDHIEEVKEEVKVKRTPRKKVSPPE